MVKHFKGVENNVSMADTFAAFLKDENGKLIDFNLKVKSDENYESQNNADDSPCKRRKLEDISDLVVVTPEIISTCEKLIRENAPEGLRELGLVLKAAVEFIDPSKVNGSPKYLVNELDVVCNIIATSADVLAPALTKYLQHHGVKSNKSVPSSSPKWKNVQSDLEEYLSDGIKLLRTKDEESHEAAIRHLLKMSAFCACYPQIAGLLVKEMLALLDSPSETIRLLVLGNLRDVLPAASENVVKYLFGKLYLSMMSCCAHPARPSNVGRTQTLLIDLCLLRPQVSCQCMSTYLQQMKIHLQAAVDSKKKEELGVINNWQFCQSLSLWAELVTKGKDDKNFMKFVKPSLNPLISLVLNTVRLNLSSTFIPMRLFCARVLIDLSQSTGYFVPIMPILTEPLRLKLFEDAPQKMTTEFVFSAVLSVDNIELYGETFMDGTIYNITELLLSYACQNSHSIAFPELVLPLVKQLMSFNETCPVKKYTKKFDQLVSKLKVVSEKISRKRRDAEVDIKDELAVTAFENDLKKESAELHKLHDSWLRERSQFK